MRHIGCDLARQVFLWVQKCLKTLFQIFVPKKIFLYTLYIEILISIVEILREFVEICEDFCDQQLHRVSLSEKVFPLPTTLFLFRSFDTAIL